MDPIRNPYAPGAGTPSPELAGRDEFREKVRIGSAKPRRGVAPAARPVRAGQVVCRASVRFRDDQYVVADGPNITLQDVNEATTLVTAALDEGFFRVRFDRLTPSGKRYLRAMAELGPGPHRSGDIAGVLKRAVQSVFPTRAQLIRKGMIWSPSHGDTDFTVPLFDGFMRRVMPGDDWGGMSRRRGRHITKLEVEGNLRRPMDSSSRAYEMSAKRGEVRHAGTASHERRKRAESP